MFTTHDHEFAQTVANRIIELTPNGIIDRYASFDEYLEDSLPPPPPLPGLIGASVFRLLLASILVFLATLIHS